MNDPNKGMSSVVNSLSSLIRVASANPRRLCITIAILSVIGLLACVWIISKQKGDFNPEATVNVQVNPTFLAAPPTTKNQAEIADAEKARLDKLLQAFSLPSPSPRSQTEIDRAQTVGELDAVEREMQRYDATSESFAAKSARERYLSAWKRLGLGQPPDLAGVR